MPNLEIQHTDDGSPMQLHFCRVAVFMLPSICCFIVSLVLIYRVIFLFLWLRRQGRRIRNLIKFPSKKICIDN